MRYWKWLAIALAVVAVLVAVAWAIGTRLPETHHAKVSAELAVLPSSLWATVVDLERWPLWRRGVESVERLPDRDGKPVYRELGANGPLVYVVEEVEPPRRLVLRVVDNPDFGGTWTFEMEAGSRGVQLDITEEGWIASPLFRTVARYLLGYEGTLWSFVADLSAELTLPS